MDIVCELGGRLVVVFRDVVLDRRGEVDGLTLAEGYFQDVAMNVSLGASKAYHNLRSH